MAPEPSVLAESTTKISSAHAIEARQRGRLAASLRMGMRMERGTLFNERKVPVSGVGYSQLTVGE